MFENVDIQHTHIHTHIRTTETYLYFKLTNEPKGSGELIIFNFKKCKHPHIGSRHVSVTYTMDSG